MARLIKMYGLHLFVVLVIAVAFVTGVSTGLVMAKHQVRIEVKLVTDPRG